MHQVVSICSQVTEYHLLYISCSKYSFISFTSYYQ